VIENNKNRQAHSEKFLRNSGAKGKGRSSNRRAALRLSFIRHNFFSDFKSRHISFHGFSLVLFMFELNAF
jgi:hypothetical protein